MSKNCKKLIKSLIQNTVRARAGQNSFNQGQTLIEAIVALGLVSIIIVALTAVTTVSLSRANFVRERVQAEKYAQEGLEWIRAERDNSWGTFFGKSSAAPGSRYCFNSSPIPAAWPASGPCGAASYLASIYKREAVLTTVGASQNQVRVQVVVTWQSGGKTHTSDQTTYLTKYER